MYFEPPLADPARLAEREAAAAARRAALILKRARRASTGLERWKKRLRYARHKVAAHQRTVNYYRKQGVTP